MKRGVVVVAALVLAGTFGGARGAGGPSAPLGVTGIALDGQVELVWQPVSGATSYNLYRGLSPTTMTALATGVTAPTYDDATAPNGTTEYYSVRAFGSGAESANSNLVQATAQARACGTGNAVKVENCFPGSSGWKLLSPDPVSTIGIEGFATASSINKGGSLDLKVNSGAGSTFRIEIYRSGYYGGAGGRLISIIPGVAGLPQPACNNDVSTGLLDCSNWSTAATITTTAAWTSGVYLIRLVRDNGSDATVIFVVRDDARTSDLLYNVPFDTYEAYNNYGGKSLYDFNSTGGRASKVSFNRPFSQPSDTSLHDWYTRADLPLVTWLEQAGYDVAYDADNDLETSPVGSHKAVVIAPHSEYWSSNMRSALQSARDARTNLFFAGSNAVYWKVRFEDSGRTLVCYKSTADPGGVTTRWRDAAGANQPENALIGEMYIGDNDSASYPLVVSTAEGQDPVWRNTPLASLAPGTTSSIGTGLVGWEWDARVANGFEPAGVITLATSPVTGGLTQTDGGQISGSANVNVTKYTAASGALVFATGTNYWSRGLALDDAGHGEPNLTIQQATTNVLFDMGVLPQTSAANIVVVGGSSRPAAPTGLAALSKTDTSISLSWNAVSGVDSYNVYRSDTPRSGGLPLGTKINASPLTGTSVSDSGLTQATVYYYVVTAVKAGLESTASSQLEVATNSTGPAATSVAVNVGGPEYVASTGTDFLADNLYYAGGNVHTTTSTISGTLDQPLYRDERYGIFSYAIPIANGTYNVTFHFAETFFAAPCAGKRIFSIDIVDTPTNPDISNLDICGLVGPNAALVRTISNVTITDGILDIQSIAGPADDPVLSALEIKPSGGGSGTPPPDPSAPPTVLSTIPADTATNVSMGIAPSATFSKAMNASTIDGTSFTLKNSSGSPVAGTVTYDATANKATFTPSATLRGAVTYTASLAGTIKASDGTTLAPFSWTFTTIPPTPLTLVATSPADLANAVATSSSVTATFSRDVDATTLTGSSFTLAPAGGPSIAATIAYNSATHTATLTPTAALAAGTDYTASLTTAITATDGGALDGPVNWSFRTAGPLYRLFSSALKPNTVHISTVNGRSGAGPFSLELGVKIRVDSPSLLDAVRFYKDDQETGSHVASVWASDGTLLEQTSFTGETASGWQQVPLTSSVPLHPNVTYVVGVNANKTWVATIGGLAAGAGSGPLHTVTDGQNGVYAAQADGTGAGVFPTQSFESSNYLVDVAVEPDGAFPAVLSTTPSAGATDVPTTPTVRATFDSSLNGATVNTTTFTLKDSSGSLVPASVSYDDTTHTATLQPTGSLIATTTYTARLDGSITGANTNPMRAPYVWTFKTTTPPPPFVASSTPPNAANGVATSSALTVTFSRDMDAASITSSSLTLAPPGGGPVSATVSYDAPTRTATLTPAAALTGGTDYTAQLAGLRSADQITMPTTSIGFRTAGAPYRLFSSALTPFRTGLSTANGRTGPGPFSLEMGVQFHVSEPETVNAFRFYKSPGETGTHTGTLWTSGGALLTSSTFVGETAAGWQQQALAQPYTIGPGTYVASVNANTFFVTTLFGLASGAGTGSLSAPIGPNGVYGDAAGLFPTQSFSSSNYFVDLAVAPDTTIPHATITASPTNPSGSSSASFSFASSKAGSSFLCALDTATFTPCASPAVYAGLTDGSHTFQVKATDPVGTEPTPASFTWRVDTTPPTTTITSNPPALTNATSASFGFSANESPVTFACSLDNAVFSSCSSPQSYSGPLAAGSHTFQVKSTDAVGNVGTPASYTWTIDTTPPNVTIGSTPANPTNQTSASFGFSADKSGSTFQCKLDSSTFAACSSAQTYNGLVAGSHTFMVQATDPAGNTSAAASSTWMIDTTPPVVSISSKPANPTNQTSASFSFGADKAGSTFQCKLDAGSYVGCTSAQSYAGPLAAGSHSFAVQATDTAGNTGTSSYSWTIDTTPPVVTISLQPANPTNQTSASFSFGADKAGSTFQCKLDAGSYAGCTSAQSYAGPLAAGSHTFTVQATDPAGNTSVPASYTWTIDTTPPTATITASPTNPTNRTSASFSFGADKGGSSFQCALDSPTFTACTSPQNYPGPLANGLHTFQVKATDPAGNTSAPASYTWTVDTTSPVVSIGSKPANPTNQTSASFSFSADKAGSTFQCKLDSGTFAACSSPQSYAGPLAAGSHTFTVQATDLAGNTGSAAYTWTIDTTSPVVSISSKPANPTNQTSASFSFSADKAGSTFQCKLDAGSYTGCTSAQSYAGPLAAGSHTFTVQATDLAGNTGSAAYTWTVDTTSPVVSISSKPANPTNQTSASFSFSADKAGSTFQCKLDAGSYVGCTSAQSYAGPLAAGSHTFTVQATDLAGNTGSAAYTWTVDTTSPVVSISSKPANPTNQTSASFSFSADKAGSSFQCKLDAGSYVGCTSAQSYAGPLAAGSHTFTVQATDLAGNTGSAAYTWTVDTTAPVVSIGSKPSNPTNQTSASFSFSADKAGSTFQCKLDTGTFAACSSPQSYAGPLAAGSHTFTVQATDPAGNTGSAAYTWTIDTTAPVVTISSKPANPTNQTSASFSFAADKAGSTFQCKLDAGSYVGCTSAQSYAGPLAAGSHTFTVQATDPAGNTGSAAYTWTIDTTAPVVTISLKPANPTNQTSASFSFGADKAGSTFQCKLDAGSYVGCTSAQSYAGPLAAGSHTFTVQATDPAGNTGSAAYTWTIDTTAPVVLISSKPANPTNQTSASFSFSADKAGSTFQCQLDGAAAVSCSSPAGPYTGLGAGGHTFIVTATDPAGNTGSTSYSWTIDTTAPVVTISSEPANPTNQTTASFSFTADKLGSTFTCQLDGGAIAPCSSPAAPYTGLAAGGHTFKVTATDPAGNASAASYTWTVDTTAPVVTISSKPANPTNATSASFSFSADKAGSSFQCQLDGAAAVSCSSPAGPYTGLAAGGHTFKVTATDPAGNTGSTSYGWTIDTTAPVVTISSKPANPTNQTTASFSFTADKLGSTFTCQLDGGAIAPCSSPAAPYTGLSAGAHTFKVTATDPAGNTGSASFSWTIDTTPPVVTIGSKPANPTNQTTASFGFTSDKLGSTFTCQLDSGAIAPCSTPAGPYSGLAAGGHTFKVTGTDPAGNTANATYSWTIDTTPPTATITASPSNPTTQTNASFSFTSSKLPSTFQCQLDGGSWSSCVSPQSYTGLSLGSHTFQVQATDQAGNTSASAPYTWLVGTAPTVNATTPAAGATGVATSVAPTATFSRAMDATTITASSFTLTPNGGSAVAATASYNSGTNTATLTPSAALAGSTTYTAKLDATVKAADGIALAAPVTWQFTTAGPSVTATTPSDTATSVVVGAAPTATFSRAMDPTTITSSSFTLTPNGGSSVAATVSYDSVAQKATLTPTASLTSNTTYTGKLDTTVKASDGTPLAGTFTWSFTTMAAPTMTSSNPANGSTNVLTSVKPSMTFSRALDPATLTTSTLILRRQDGSQAAAAFSYNSATYTVTFTPGQPLDLSKTYTVTATTGVKAAGDGTPLAAPATFSFTTTATPYPVRINAGGGVDGLFSGDLYFKGGTTLSTAAAIAGTTDPALFQAQRVGNATAGLWSYTIPVPNGTYDVKLYFAEIQKTAAGQRKFNIDLPATPANPDIANLDIFAAAGGANTAYSVTIPGVATCGASQIRINTTAVIDYPAIAGIEVIPAAPTVCSTSPASNATAVARTALATATFSRQMDATTITGASFTLTNGGVPIAATVSYDAATNKATLTPSATLAANTTYTAKLVNTVKGSDGTAIAGYSWTFTTGP